MPTIKLEVPEELSKREQVRAALHAGGLTLVELPATGGPAPLSQEARVALARQVPPGRPLSEIIIEEREGQRN